MNIVSQLLLNPAILSLIFGYLIGISSRANFPKKIIDFISIYLIFIVGFKGGACLGIAGECAPPLIALAIVGVCIGFIQPFLNYVILSRSTALDRQTAAVIASQFGSISIVTFVTGITFLVEREIPYNTFMSAIAGIMELPALFSGLFLLRLTSGSKRTSLFKSLWSITKSIFATKKISMIFVGFFTGYLFRILDLYKLSNLIVSPFNLLLVFFMVDIGTKIAKQRKYFSCFNAPLFVFGTFMPVVMGSLGLFIAFYFVTYQGSAILFALLLASASYIAVPAIMETYAPDAKQAIYMPMALGVTLPFNILVGIPLFYYISSWLF